MLFRFADMHLAEFVWNEPAALPRIELDGRRLHAIPLPALRTYRQLRGLMADPAPGEHLPPIHSARGPALGTSGLYDEECVLLALAATRLPDAEVARALQAASAHGQRHGYARALVVDHRVPLPVVQTLLGHASVKTTAVFARTGQAEVRTFVEASFRTGN